MRPALLSVLVLLGCSGGGGEEPAAAVLAPKAFPGAEGYGADTPGGRGGNVLIVDSLADDGSAGTLRWALLQPYPRIVVFRVSGIIEAAKPLFVGGGPGEPPLGEEHSYLTVAGQSAPGGGISIANFPISLTNGVHDVVIRHLRLRNLRVDETQGSIGDGIELRTCSNAVVDHCSIAWASDEGISIESESSQGASHDITIMNCLVAETLTNGGHPCRCDHSRGMIASDGTYNVSFHHNFVVSCDQRNPRVVGPTDGSGTPQMDVRYNLIYNWGDRGGQVGFGARVNLVGNVYRFGPDTTAPTIFETTDAVDFGTAIYLEGNCRVTGADTDCPADQATLFPPGSPLTFAAAPFPAPTVTPKADLVNRLLANAGALPRDSADLQFVADYNGFTGNLGGGGLTHDQIVVPAPAPGGPDPDTDLDGMPDWWEDATPGLNKFDPTDPSLDLDGDGYTEIEEYLNWRAQVLEG